MALSHHAKSYLIVVLIRCSLTDPPYVRRPTLLLMAKAEFEGVAEFWVPQDQVAKAFSGP